VGPEQPPSAGPSSGLQHFCVHSSLIMCQNRRKAHNTVCTTTGRSTRCACPLGGTPSTITRRRQQNPGFFTTLTRYADCASHMVLPACHAALSILLTAQATWCCQHAMLPSQSSGRLPVDPGHWCLSFKLSNGYCSFNASVLRLACPTCFALRDQSMWVLSIEKWTMN
jgi:hypothetical protein